MRNAIWELARRNHPEGQILTPWLKAVRWLLYPLDTFYWVMSRTRGYQLDMDIWLIDGVKYSGKTLRIFAQAQGQTYTITRSGDVVTLTYCPPSENDNA